MPTNVIFGIGRAGRIDPNRFDVIYRKSPRGHHHYGYGYGQLAQYAFANSRLWRFRTRFWISRSIAENNKPTLAISHRRALYQRNANPRLRQLLYRADGDLLSGIMQGDGRSVSACPG